MKNIPLSEKAQLLEEVIDLFVIPLANHYVNPHGNALTVTAVCKDAAEWMQNNVAGGGCVLCSHGVNGEKRG